jgi:hypothetical protein
VIDGDATPPSGPAPVRATPGDLVRLRGASYRPAMTEAVGRRSRPILLAAAVCGAALTGCAAGPPEAAEPGVAPAAAVLTAPAGAPASSSSSSPAAGSSSAPADLSAGLLPESAFGDADVHTWSGADGGHGHHGFPGWWGGGLGHHGWGPDVQPDSCATALDQATKGLPDDTAADLDSASRVAVAGQDDTVTMESLVQGQVPSVDQLRSALTACSTATMAGPGPWKVTVTVTPFDVPALGKGSVAVRTEVSATGTKDDDDHQRSALFGVAQDGNRLVVLMATGTNAAASQEKAFGDLLQRAYQVQADALD